MVIIPKSIQDSMLADAVKYNIRLHFPNAERTDICNNQIVEGSAKFTESLCSQDSLKFGLCESPTFECETVGVGNIANREIDIIYDFYSTSLIALQMQNLLMPLRASSIISLTAAKSVLLP